MAAYTPTSYYAATSTHSDVVLVGDVTGATVPHTRAHDSYVIIFATSAHVAAPTELIEAIAELDAILRRAQTVPLRHPSPKFLGTFHNLYTVKGSLARGNGMLPKFQRWHIRKIQGSHV